jgi:hypothetical protein
MEITESKSYEERSKHAEQLKSHDGHSCFENEKFQSFRGGKNKTEFEASDRKEMHSTMKKRAVEAFKKSETRQENQKDVSVSDTGSTHTANKYEFDPYYAKKRGLTSDRSNVDRISDDSRSKSAVSIQRADSTTSGKRFSTDRVREEASGERRRDESRAKSTSRSASLPGIARERQKSLDQEAQKIERRETGHRYGHSWNGVRSTSPEQRIVEYEKKGGRSQEFEAGETQKIQFKQNQASSAHHHAKEEIDRFSKRSERDHNKIITAQDQRSMKQNQRGSNLARYEDYRASEVSQNRYENHGIEQHDQTRYATSLQQNRKGEQFEQKGEFIDVPVRRSESFADQSRYIPQGPSTKSRAPQNSGIPSSQVNSSATNTDSYHPSAAYYNYGCLTCQQEGYEKATSDNRSLNGSKLREEAKRYHTCFRENKGHSHQVANHNKEVSGSHSELNSQTDQRKAQLHQETYLKNKRVEDEDVHRETYKGNERFNETVGGMRSQIGYQERESSTGYRNEHIQKNEDLSKVVRTEMRTFKEQKNQFESSSQPRSQEYQNYSAQHTRNNLQETQPYNIYSHPVQQIHHIQKDQQNFRLSSSQSQRDQTRLDQTNKESINLPERFSAQDQNDYSFRSIAVQENREEPTLMVRESLARGKFDSIDTSYPQGPRENELIVSRGQSIPKGSINGGALINEQRFERRSESRSGDRFNEPEDPQSHIRGKSIEKNQQMIVKAKTASTVVIPNDRTLDNIKKYEGDRRVINCCTQYVYNPLIAHKETQPPSHQFNNNTALLQTEQSQHQEIRSFSNSKQSTPIDSRTAQSTSKPAGSLVSEPHELHRRSLKDQQGYTYFNKTTDDYHDDNIDQLPTISIRQPSQAEISPNLTRQESNQGRSSRVDDQFSEPKTFNQIETGRFRKQQEDKDLSFQARVRFDESPSHKPSQESANRSQSPFPVHRNNSNSLTPQHEITRSPNRFQNEGQSQKDSYPPEKTSTQRFSNFEQRNSEINPQTKQSLSRRDERDLRNQNFGYSAVQREDAALHSTNMKQRPAPHEIYQTNVFSQNHSAERLFLQNRKTSDPLQSDNFSFNNSQQNRPSMDLRPQNPTQQYFNSRESEDHQMIRATHQSDAIYQRNLISSNGSLYLNKWQNLSGEGFIEANQLESIPKESFLKPGLGEKDVSPRTIERDYITDNSEIERPAEEQISEERRSMAQKKKSISKLVPVEQNSRYSMGAQTEVRSDRRNQTHFVDEGTSTSKVMDSSPAERRSEYLQNRSRGVSAAQQTDEEQSRRASEMRLRRTTTGESRMGLKMEQGTEMSHKTIGVDLVDEGVMTSMIDSKASSNMPPEETRKTSQARPSDQSDLRYHDDETWQKKKIPRDSSAMFMKNKTADPRAFFERLEVDDITNNNRKKLNYEELLRVAEEFLVRNKVDRDVESLLLNLEQEEFVVKFSQAGAEKLNSSSRRLSAVEQFPQLKRFKIVPLDRFEDYEADYILSKREMIRESWV